MSAEIVIPASVSALLFDLDGTVVDNMAFHRLAWQHLFTKLGQDWSLDRISAEVWGKNEDIFQRIFPDVYTAEQVAELSLWKEQRYIECYRPHITMMTGLKGLLEAALRRGRRTAVATAAPTVCVDFVKDALDLTRYFQQIVHADMVTRSKPHPETFLTAATLLGAEPQSCIVFEDAPVGVRAAEAAGMPCYVLLTTHREDEFSEFSNVRGFVKDYSSFEITG